MDFAFEYELVENRLQLSREAEGVAHGVVGKLHLLFPPPQDYYRGAATERGEGKGVKGRGGRSAASQAVSASHRQHKMPGWNKPTSGNPVTSGQPQSSDRGAHTRSMRCSSVWMR